MDNTLLQHPLIIAVLVPMVGLGFYGLFHLLLRHKNTEHTAVNWSPYEAVGITIAIYFLSQILGGIILGTYLGATGQNSDAIQQTLSTSNVAQFSFVLLVESMTAGTILWFVRRRQTALSAIGIVRPRWHDILAMLGGFVAYFGLYIALIIIVTALVPGLNLDQKQDLGFSTDSSSHQLGLVFVSLVLLPPLVEELLCRGFLYSGLRTKLSFIPAAIITSVLFAAAHLQAGSGNALLWVAAMDTFTLSLVLVYLREKTGSLWPGIGLHMLKNLIAFLALFVFHAN